MTLPARSMEAFQPEAAELLLKPGGALLLEEGGRGDAAELQVDLVDPLFLAREPLQALAHTAVVRQFGDVKARGSVDWHALSPV